MIDCLVTWISIKEKLPLKEGYYLILAHSANKDSPFCYMAWYSLKNKQWEIIPEAWADKIEYWSFLPIPKGF